MGTHLFLFFCVLRALACCSGLPFIVHVPLCRKGWRRPAIISMPQGGSGLLFCAPGVGALFDRLCAPGKAAWCSGTLFVRHVPPVNKGCGSSEVVVNCQLVVWAHYAMVIVTSNIETTIVQCSVQPLPYHSHFILHDDTKMHSRCKR